MDEVLREHNPLTYDVVSYRFPNVVDLMDHCFRMQSLNIH
jgi:hypothetical protein